MNRVFKILTFELKKSKNIKFLMFTIAIFLIISVISSISTEITDIPQKFKMFIPYIFLFNTFSILGCEFENNTDKVIFSGIFKRHEILLSKLFCMIIKGIVIWLSYTLINIIINIFLVKDINFTLAGTELINSLLAIIIYSFTIGSVILLISILTSNSKLSGILVYILFFDLMSALLDNALAANSLTENTKHFIKNIPFYIANTGIIRNGYSLVQSITLLATGIFCLYVTIILLNQKHI